MVTADTDLPAWARIPSYRQWLFVRYFTAILVDLVVLNLFVEYWGHVVIDSFTISLLCAILLQILLKMTIVVEQRVAAFWKARRGRWARFMRFFCAWLVLFGSKFVILEAIDLGFGDRVEFGGPLQGLVALVVVISVMLLVEEAIVQFVRRLG